jgi:hypothetical protein
VTSLMGSRRFVPGDRFFPMAEYLTVHLDMETYAVCAANNLAIRPPGQQFARLGCRQFPLDIRHNVFGPFWATFQPSITINAYELFFEPKQQRGQQTQFTSDKWGRLAEMFWHMGLLYFYEQHVSWIHQTYGRQPKDRDTWPSLLRFAWALRNAATHHNGCLNITDPKVPPVVWHHLKYDHNDAGLRVLGDVMTLGDILVFLIEFSDELDRLGCPNP